MPTQPSVEEQVNPSDLRLAATKSNLTYESMKSIHSPPKSKSPDRDNLPQILVSLNSGFDEEQKQIKETMIQRRIERNGNIKNDEVFYKEFFTDKQHQP